MTLSSSAMAAFAALDVTAPSVNSIVPDDGAVNQPVNITIAIVFDEPMNQASVEEAFFLQDATGGVEGSFSWGENEVVFIPDSNLEYSTEYTVMLTSARDLAGNAMAFHSVSGFTTELVSFTSYPAVLSFLPDDGAMDVSFRPSLVAVFSRGMDQVSVEEAFKASDGDLDQAGTFYWNDEVTVIFTPHADLSPYATYTAVIGVNAVDTGGVPLEHEFHSAFTVGSGKDVSAPTVLATNPASDAVNVTASSSVSVSFSEAMDEDSVLGAFRLTDGSLSVSGGFSWRGNTVSFQPDEDLGYGVGYAIVITEDAQDLAGNPLSAEFIANFQVRSAPDSIPPTVTSVTPVDSMTDVVPTTELVVTFSEAMDSFTVEAAFDLNDGGTSVVGVFSWPAANQVTFTPAVQLNFSAAYSLTINGAASDIAGNPVGSDFISSFSTKDPDFCWEVDPLKVADIAFTDPKLAACTFKPDGVIYACEVTQIRDCNDTDGYTSLAGLEQMSNLTVVSMEYVNMADLTPLSSLSLSALNLVNSTLGDLSSLSSQVDLMGMSLNDSTFPSIAPIPGTEIIIFSVSDTNISDISSFVNYNKLQYLYMVNANVADLSPLASNTRLVTIDANNGVVSNVSGLANKSSLVAARLNDNNITDVSAFDTSGSSIFELNLSNNYITTGVINLDHFNVSALGTLNLTGNNGALCSELNSLQTKYGAKLLRPASCSTP